MSRALLASILLTTLSLLLIACSSKPGSSGSKGRTSDGGGSADAPAAGEVRNAIKKLTTNIGESEWFYVPTSFYLNESDATIDRPLASPLHDILEKIHENYEHPREVKIRFEENGPCEGSDGDQEASTKLCDTSAPICFSIPMIQKRYPKVTLNESLKPLIMHELAHQSCADEDLAKQVERYYSTTTTAGASAIYDMQYHARMLTIYIDNVRRILLKKADATDLSICKQLGSISAYEETFVMDAAEAVRREGVDDLATKQRDAGLTWDGAIRQAENFCETFDWNTPPTVHLGNRDELLKNIETQAKAQQDIADELRRLTKVIVLVPDTSSK